MEREWENEEEIEIEWGNGDEKDRELGNGEIFTLYISSFSFYFIPLYPFLDQKLSHFVAKCLIRHFCCECYKQLNISAMRK